MDGLLLDTEDLYTAVLNVMLKEHGKPELPWTVKSRMQGKVASEVSRIDEAVALRARDTDPSKSHRVSSKSGRSCHSATTNSGLSETPSKKSFSPTPDHCQA